jgi:hypothetical protein
MFCRLGRAVFSLPAIPDGEMKKAIPNTEMAPNDCLPYKNFNWSGAIYLTFGEISWTS